ncbi:MAG: hypothetical protein N5P05_001671 [Chroococcopsis gigantea SAG 12.99]|jgi:hypothetical protein|nr:hypothetical protein [Chroococcopsis gigantea SAG 12.99]
MKCINCGTDNNLRDRTGNNGRCKNCNHQFAFEPTSMTGRLKFTDLFFAKLLNDISVNKTLYFTNKQLLYLLDKRLKFKKINLVGIGCIGVFFYVWATLFFGGLLAPVTGGASIVVVPVVLFLAFMSWLFFQSRSNTVNYQARQIATKSFLLLSGLFLLVGVKISLNINSLPLFVIITLLGMSSIYYGTRQLMGKKSVPQSFSISLEQIRDWLQRWQSINGSVEKILSPTSNANPPVQINPEIMKYSFDRVVICQSTEITQFLIANNFHFENNCAVLSVDGYPANIFETILQMLRQNPELQVYALHNADPGGVTLVNHLKTSNNWFAGSTATIYDMGLSPRQVSSNPKLFVQESNEVATAAKELPQEIRQILLPEEIKWLEAGYFIELESFSPQHLLRIVTRSIILSRQEQGLIVLEEEDRAYGSIYAVESFG